MKRILKITAIVVGCLLLVAVTAGVWFATRPPKPAKIFDPQPTGQRVIDKGLFANYFPAAGGERKPGVLLLGGSEGGLGRDVMRQAVLLQQAGYNVLHVAYHNAPGQPPQLKNVPVENFCNGLDWLKARPEVNAQRLAIVGYSKGAEAALLVATRYPGISAVVAGMPSSVVWDGLDPPSILLGLNSSWSENDRPIASLGYGWFDSERGLYGVFEDGLKTVGEHPETVIPVEKFAGRLLLICGGKDDLWPACPMAEQILSRATKNAGPATQLLRYPEAGHGVMGAPAAVDDPDMRKFAQLGGTAQANAAARADSWPKIMAFLSKALAPASPQARETRENGDRS